MLSGKAVSRAFIKEDAQHDDVQVVRRAPLPEGASNLVTERGLALLRAEEAEIRAALAQSEGDARRQLALETALDELLGRLMSAEVRVPGDGVEVAFGHLVELEPVAGEGSAFSITIVGVDEADPEAELVSYLAPLAQALIGRRVGDTVSLGASLRAMRIAKISASSP